MARRKCSARAVDCPRGLQDLERVSRQRSGMDRGVRRNEPTSAIHPAPGRAAPLVTRRLRLIAGSALTDMPFAERGRREIHALVGGGNISKYSVATYSSSAGNGPRAAR